MCASLPIQGDIGDAVVGMEARARRPGKPEDRSVRPGAQPVQQLQKNAQNISGIVLNIERTVQDLDTGTVITFHSTPHPALRWLWLIPLDLVTCRTCG